MSKESVIINNMVTNAKFRDKRTIERLSYIKNVIGINSDSEVLRFCINNVYINFKRVSKLETKK